MGDRIRISSMCAEAARLIASAEKEAAATNFNEAAKLREKANDALRKLDLGKVEKYLGSSHCNAVKAHLGIVEGAPLGDLQRLTRSIPVEPAVGKDAPATLKRLGIILASGIQGKEISLGEMEAISERYPTEKQRIRARQGLSMGMSLGDLDVLDAWVKQAGEAENKLEMADHLRADYGPDEMSIGKFTFKVPQEAVAALTALAGDFPFLMDINPEAQSGVYSTFLPDGTPISRPVMFKPSQQPTLTEPDSVAQKKSGKKKKPQPEKSPVGELFEGWARSIEALNVKPSKSHGSVQKMIPMSEILRGLQKKKTHGLLLKFLVSHNITNTETLIRVLQRHLNGHIVQALDLLCMGVAGQIITVRPKIPEAEKKALGEACLNFIVTARRIAKCTFTPLSDDTDQNRCLEYYAALLIRTTAVQKFYPLREYGERFLAEFQMCFLGVVITSTEPRHQPYTFSQGRFWRLHPLHVVSCLTMWTAQIAIPDSATTIIALKLADMRETLKGAPVNVTYRYWTLRVKVCKKDEPREVILTRLHKLAALLGLFETLHSEAIPSAMKPLIETKNYIDDIFRDSGELFRKLAGYMVEFFSERTFVSDTQGLSALDNVLVALGQVIDTSLRILGVPKGSDAERMEQEEAYLAALALILRSLVRLVNPEPVCSESSKVHYQRMRQTLSVFLSIVSEAIEYWRGGHPGNVTEVLDAIEAIDRFIQPKTALPPIEGLSDPQLEELFSEPSPAKKGVAKRLQPASPAEEQEGGKVSSSSSDDDDDAPPAAKSGSPLIDWMAERCPEPTHPIRLAWANYANRKPEDALILLEGLRMSPATTTELSSVADRQTEMDMCTLATVLETLAHFDILVRLVDQTKRESFTCKNCFRDLLGLLAAIAKHTQRINALLELSSEILDPRLAEPILEQFEFFRESSTMSYIIRNMPRWCDYVNQEIKAIEARALQIRQNKVRQRSVHYRRNLDVARVVVNCLLKGDGPDSIVTFYGESSEAVKDLLSELCAKKLLHPLFLHPDVIAAKEGGTLAASLEDPESHLSCMLMAMVSQKTRECAFTLAQERRAQYQYADAQNGERLHDAHELFLRRYGSK